MSKKMVDMFIALIDEGNYTYADFSSHDLNDDEKSYILNYMREKMIPTGIKAPTPQENAIMNMKMAMHMGTGKRKWQPTKECVEKCKYFEICKKKCEVNESRNTDSSQ